MSSGSPKTSRFGIQAMFLVLFAVLCGIAGTGLRQWRQTPPAVAVPAAAPQQFRILLAASDLLPGREIKASDFYTSMVGKDEYKKVLGNVSAFGDGKQLIGRIIRNKVEINKPFPLECVFPEGTGPTPADLLTAGMRAITVKMNLVGGIRGFVAPESWVDVLFRRSDKQVAPDSTAAARTHTVFPGVRVLAIQDSLYPQTVLTKDQHGSVAQEFEITLELTPQQCEVLKSIENRGELTLNMLPKDPDRLNSGALPSPETMKLLLGVEEPRPVVVAPMVPSVRVVRGGAQSSVVVDQAYDLVIDQHLYPAGSKSGSDVDDSVPAPDALPGTAWPQAIPPAGAKGIPGDSTESASPTGGSASGPEGSQPATPQPARGSRAILDTTFAQHSATTRYPGRERSAVSSARSVTRYRPTTATSPQRQPSQSVLQMTNTAQESPRVNRAISSVQRPVSMTGLESPRARQTSTVSGGTSRNVTHSASAMRSLTLLSGGSRKPGEIRRSFAEYPQHAVARVDTGSTRGIPRPVQRSSQRTLVVSGGSLRRSSHSGLIELGSGATNTAESSLAYVVGTQRANLPELKIGRR